MLRAFPREEPPMIVGKDPSPLGKIARFAIAAAGFWILLGALFKLFWGTPADLPQSVKDVPLELGTTYRMAIAIELVLATLAFLKPRWAWLPLLGALMVFDIILGKEMEAGAASCKCFGGKVEMPPELMMGIDSALFLAIVLTRPWITVGGKGAPAVLLAALAAGCVALPWVYDRESAAPSGEVVADGRTVKNAYAILDVASWVGKDIGETEVGKRLTTDPYQLPPSALWVLYRWTCDHCAEHLERLAEQEHGQRFLVLCRLKEKNDSDENRALRVLPEGEFVLHAELPDTVEYVITTPAEIEVEEFVVQRAEEGVSDEH